MAKYRLDPQAAPHVLADGQTVLAGQVFETDDENLVTKFANKFIAVGEGEQASVVDGAHIRPDPENVVEADGSRIKTAGPDLSQSAMRPDAASAGPTTMNTVDPQEVEATGRGVTTAGKNAEVASDEGADEMTDVSGDFEGAKDAGLQVWKDRRGWHVYDGKELVSEKPLRKMDVDPFIKDFNS
jgi:hypothetical protein